METTANHLTTPAALFTPEFQRDPYPTIGTISL